MTTGKALNGKPYAGNPHVRFDEGEVASAATPRRGSLLYKIAKACCRSLAATLCVATVLPLVAFDWKAKPVAELKADLVSYAREVGETNLADRVEKSVGTAEWMRLAIGRGTELLKASEGCDFRDKRREHGLRIIDYPLHFDNYSKDASLEDVRAFNEVVYAYCASARDRVFAEVARAEIPEGQLRLWRIYNMGFVIKGPRHTVAIDVTYLPLFRDKPDRRCAPKSAAVVLSGWITTSSYRRRA